MIGNYLRKTLRPAAFSALNIFSFSGLSPKTVSLLQLVFAFGVFLSVVSARLVPAIFFLSVFGIATITTPLFFRRVRFKNREWAYLNSIILHFSEALILLGFSLFYPVASFLAIAFSAISEYAKARLSLVLPNSGKAWPEIGNRPDRLGLLSAGLVFAFFAPEIFGFKTIEIALFLVALAALACFTERFRFAIAKISVAERKKAGK